MSLFEQFLQTLAEDLQTVAREYGREYTRALIKVGRDFAEQTRDDLLRWGKLAAAGQLSEDDFKWLLQSKKDALEMELLKQEGLALVQKDRLQQAIIDTVAGALTQTFSA